MIIWTYFWSNLNRLGRRFYFRRNYIGRVSGPAVQHAAEIQAAIKAIEVAETQGIQSLCIRTRSKFLPDSARDWHPSWQREDPYRYPPKLLSDFYRLDMLKRRGKVRLWWEYFVDDNSYIMRMNWDTYNSFWALEDKIYSLAEKGAEQSF